MSYRLAASAVCVALLAVGCAEPTSTAHDAAIPPDTGLFDSGGVAAPDAGPEADGGGHVHGDDAGPGDDAAGLDGGGHAHGTPDAGPPSDAGRGAPDGEEIFRRQCAACHTIGRGPTTRGPDLSGVTTRRPTMWLTRWLTDPATAPRPPWFAALLAEWDDRLMPDPGLDAAQIASVLDFIAAQSARGPLEPLPPIALSDAEYESARSTYFDRCAGCHGTMRLGATGPTLTDARATALGTDLLGAVMRHGTPWGMPPFGVAGILDDATIARMAAFLQRPVPAAPAFTLADAVASWELVVPVADRPAAPEHARDWENYFGVVLRDAGQVAIFDGDTHDEIARIDTGFAVHILRASSTGRYFYAIGRDGRITMIDLWSATPRTVARARGCFDARSVQGSAAPGYEDRLLVEGCYWPSQYAVFDGQTLEPRSITSVLDAGGASPPEVRVASIVASTTSPLWVLALKEAGQVALVDYAAPGAPIVARIDADLYLHDGGWDHTRRYFLAAANASDRISVIDVEERRMVASIETGRVPHPGRGANFVDPTYGWVNATVHLGEGLLLLYGADPVAHPEHAWRVVRRIPLPSAGSLFLKTHPRSPWLFLDMPLSSDPAAARQVCVYSIARGELDRCWSPSTAGPSVHFEFDRDGAEVWVSAWGTSGELVVYDAVTLEERRRITGLPTPTGKFNVYNTAHDVY
jgi:nitrite reductase (NO-forming)/hydroxylamine reductase